MAMARGYMRSHSSRCWLGSGRGSTAAPMAVRRRQPIRRSLSLSDVNAAALRPGGIPKSSTMLADRPAPGLRGGGASRLPSSIGSFRGAHVGEGMPQMHERAATQEQLVEMAVRDVLADPAAAEELEQLEADTSLPLPPSFALERTVWPGWSSPEQSPERPAPAPPLPPVLLGNGSHASCPENVPPSSASQSGNG